MEGTEKNLRVELENSQTALVSGQSGRIEVSIVESTFETGQDTGAANLAKLDELENKKKELVCIFAFDLIFLLFFLFSIYNN